MFTWPVGVHYLIPFTKRGLTQPIKCLGDRVLAADNRVSARNFHVAKVNSCQGSEARFVHAPQFTQLSDRVSRFTRSWNHHPSCRRRRRRCEAAFPRKDRAACSLLKFLSLLRPARVCIKIYSRLVYQLGV